MIRILLYIGIGFLLIVVNLWYVLSAWQNFFGGRATVFAGFRVIGKEDPEGKLGSALAHMVVARLGKIEQDLDGALRVLETPPGQSGAGSLRRLDRVTHEFVFPKEVVEPLNIAVSVGGTEVGGILTWIHRTMTEQNIIQFTVEYQERSALVVGVIDARTSDTVYISTKEPTNDSIAASIAYLLAQRAIASRVKEFDALEGDSFRELFNILTESAQLNRQVTLGLEPGTRYADLLKRLEPIIAIMDEWKPLTRLAGDLSFAAKDYNKALTYYEATLKLTKENDESLDWLKQRIAQTKDSISAIAQPSAVTAQPAATIELANAISSVRQASGAKAILDLVGATTQAMSRAPRIAVFGGVPPKGLLPDGQVEILGSGAGTSTNNAQLETYVSSIVQTVSLIAPQAKFVFSPLAMRGGGFSSSDVLIALDQFASAHPDIILITVGLLEGVTFHTILEDMAKKGILIVLAAGNNQGLAPFVGTTLLSSIMVVAATDLEGRPADFTARGEGVFWAPGVAIPVVDDRGVLDVRDGTSYSAAIGAGVAAQLLAEREGLGPTDLLGILRETGKSKAQGRPDILQADAALAKLMP